MSLRKLTLAAATVAAFLFPAVAEAALTTGSVNLRTGPSTGYGVITTLPPGAYVAVSRCVPGWCLVRAGGVSGWLSSSYIGNAAPRYSPRIPPPPMFYAPYPRYYGPYPYRRFYGGPSYYGPGYGFYFNFGPRHHRWH